MDKLDGLSMNIEQTERDKLRSIFPQCFVEGRLDIDKLLTMCGEYITDDFEKYEFKWKGKSECLQLAQKRSTGTLRPCREESVNFDTTQNLYIEGDNLEVLKLLQTSYYRKVKMIYIDPPYNTGNDFVYEDDFADPMARYKEITSQATKSNPETMGRFHTNWLNMMYPRLRLAANLLRDDGIVFVSIDDNEVHNMRKLCDEVFGEENFVDCLIWKKRYGGGAKEKHLVTLHEYVLFYAKNIDDIGEIFVPLSEESIERYYIKKDQNFEIRGAYRTHPIEAVKSMDARPNLVYPIEAPDGTLIHPKKQWIWSQERVIESIKKNEIEFTKTEKGWIVSSKQYLKNENGEVRLGKAFSVIDDVYTQHGTNEIISVLSDAKIFPFPKPIELLKKLLNIGTEKDSIILDFFSGSGTTAHTIMQLNTEDGGNRRFICVQLPELCEEKSEAYKAGYKNICEIGKERIRRAGAKILESDTQIKLGDEATSLDIGFRVFKLDTSNLKIWDNTPIPNNDITELERRLLGILEIIKDDRTNLDVVYEVMLKLGQDLCEDIIELDINGKTVYGVGADVTFIVCLAEHITPEDAEAMAEYAPGRIIFTDQCFDNLSDKSNVKLIMRERGITLKTL